MRYLDALAGFCSQTAIGKKSALCDGPFFHFIYGLVTIFSAQVLSNAHTRTIKQVNKMTFRRIKLPPEKTWAPNSAQAVI
jgi:hypothetical protein